MAIETASRRGEFLVLTGAMLKKLEEPNCYAAISASATKNGEKHDMPLDAKAQEVIGR
jgi:hypothetical protein